MSDLGPTLARLAALLGPPDGEAVPLDGGITNRNWKVGFGGSPYVIREPGKDTDLLGIDRNAEWAASCAAARAGVGPPVRAMLEDPPILVTAFVEGDPVTEEELQRPELLRNVASSLHQMHESGEELPSTFSPFRIVEDYAPDRLRARRRAPRGVRRSTQVRKTDREGPARAPSTTPSPATTTCWPETCSSRGPRCASWTGSTREWETATSTSATSP